MVIENPPMVRKGHDHVCIGLGCFLLVFPFFFFIPSNSIQSMCAAGAVATVVAV